MCVYYIARSYYEGKFAALFFLDRRLEGKEMKMSRELLCICRDMLGFLEEEHTDDMAAIPAHELYNMFIERYGLELGGEETSMLYRVIEDVRLEPSNIEISRVIIDTKLRSCQKGGRYGYAGKSD